MGTKYKVFFFVKLFIYLNKFNVKIKYQYTGIKCNVTSKLLLIN